MNNRECEHNNIAIINRDSKLIVKCFDCGLEGITSNIKCGMYSIYFDDNIYLLDTVKDLRFLAEPYYFELKNSNKKSKVKQLCKTMKTGE